ncbi:unnamed protein product [Pneumocystis jirovecii]|uniref:Uncharacterized protein n=1 Tax=Pneumocystis jirovecii TaxID=42068 RepID=L0PCA6_PNEJI|nr:unnamed protein product [Pneumocystis jirovecii]CCJ30262.1 unnamed protein product [Pneumocystis jirovecii]
MRPQRPSKASISRTKIPLPMPPNAGLHDEKKPILLILCVKITVFNPLLATAHAASQPAWPPPITTTSNVRIPSILVKKRR